MRPFTKEDLPMINSWLVSRGKKSLEIEDLPKCGMIEEGVAVGFLCIAEANCGFMDGFVTNPAAKSEARNKALNRIATWIIALARSAGIKNLMVITGEVSLMKRAEDLGFTISDVFAGKKIL